MHGAHQYSFHEQAAYSLDAIMRMCIICAHRFLVFFMQVGFIQVEVGYGRTKNIKNILLKNTVDVLISALCWW